MSDENVSKENDSQAQEPAQEGGESDGGKEADIKQPAEVKTSPHRDEEEMEPPKEPLRDPRTGERLRDQSPGVPNSKWVGNHSIHDVDNIVKEPVIPESDFGKE